MSSISPFAFAVSTNCLAPLTVIPFPIDLSIYLKPVVSELFKIPLNNFCALVDKVLLLSVVSVVVLFLSSVLSNNPLGVVDFEV